MIASGRLSDRHVSMPWPDSGPDSRPVAKRKLTLFLRTQIHRSPILPLNSQLKDTTFLFTTKGVRGIKARGSAGKRTSLDVRVHSSPAVASPNTRRQYTALKLMARQGTQFSGIGKARVRVRKTPISVRFRHSPCRSNGITLKTQLCRLGRTVSASRKLLSHDSHPCIGNTPAPGGIATVEIASVQPSLQESMANESGCDFTVVDWFTVAMFVLQCLIWITLGCLFVSVLGS